MSLHPRAGKQAQAEDLADIPQLMTDYFSLVPDVANPQQKVAFGTSGHRGSSSKVSFNEAHILAITQAIADYRKEQGINGELFLGKDTHALSDAAFASCLRVLIANGVKVVIQKNNGYTPTPVISHAILNANKNKSESFSDGIIITPSHNPPKDGGIKYNPPHGGPADAEITNVIEKRANEIIAAGLTEVRSLSLAEAQGSDVVRQVDLRIDYIDQLDQVINMQAIADAKVKIGVDPLGGSGIHYWSLIAEKYGLDIEVVNENIDPQFAFMPLDKDGKIRMDCSSPFAMSGLIALKDKFDIAVGNDPDYDRHGIVTKSAGLMNPNHYLAVAINYLCQHRPDWQSNAAIGKTLVSSSMIDRVVKKNQRQLAEVPVGFKWFVDGLLKGDYLFGGEESAGASFLKFDGSVWSTDKDGIILALLAAEILAVTGKDPAQHYAALEAEFGSPKYKRIDAPANVEQKNKLKKLTADNIQATELAGEKILNIFSHAAANNAPIGGVKVVTENGWFAARPSGTEDIYKIYCESFNGEEHLLQIQQQAQQIVDQAIQ